MNVLLAPDAFKDSVTAEAAAEAMKQGVLAFNAEVTIHTMAVSDGGEGFLAAVSRYESKVERVEVATSDPLGRPIKAYYLWNTESHTAFVELAAASGIELLTKAERDARKTSTLGTGILIKNAIDRGATTIYLGIGGSATNDGGMGIAQALGYRFLDADNNPLSPNGESLIKIKHIVSPKETYANIQFVAVNDVQNLLFGSTGAAYTFAEQKGASEATIEILDQGLQNLDIQVSKSLGRNEALIPGAGAAGGTAYGLRVFCNAEYIKGTDFIFELSGLEHLLSEKNMDLIITGEGKIDGQTIHGKFIHGLTQIAEKFQIPVFAICGKLEMDRAQLKQLGLQDARELYDPNLPDGYSFTHAESLIQKHVIAMLQDAFGATL